MYIFVKRYTKIIISGKRSDSDTLNHQVTAETEKTNNFDLFMLELNYNCQRKLYHEPI